MLNHALERMDHKGLEVHVIDDDIVEENNVGRQMFTYPDIGDHKARAAVSKINMAYGLDWSCELVKFNENQLYADIVITAVDNVATRRKVNKCFYMGNKIHGHIQNRRKYWIDCGNGRDFGQVVLSDHGHTLANIFDLDPDLKDTMDDVEVQGRGCSYADGLQEQGLFINTEMAQIAVTMLERMLADRYIRYNVVYSNLATMSKSSMLKFFNH